MDRTAVGLLVLLLAGGAAAEEDAYLRYVREAPEFRPVARVGGRWDTWVYMPWRYRWTIGTGDAGGRFCREYGIRGGFTDHGRADVLPWLEKWGLRFYADHTASKGILHLKGDRRRFRALQRDPRAVRDPPLDAATLARARTIVAANVARLRESPMRLAYALDDETSWGSFVIPLPWRVHAHDGDYAAWLARYHGAPVEPRFVGPDFVFAQLGGELAELDFSPFLDRMSYQDSVFAGFVGALVEEANRADPGTPCGVVGAQNPSLWGGYDYAKLMKKLQFCEAYDLGSAWEIARSLAPDAVMVSTHFHKDGESDAWKAWYRFAHGHRGMIGWVEGWFDGETPRPWLKEFAPTLKELGGVQGPKLHGARWVHDGIAIYYSHPSIQVSWCLDAAAHGKTWPNRNRDHLLGTSHNVRKAWELLLNDAGLQYGFVAYDEVARDGVPQEYDVLILPACFALSDVEARRIREFAARGGRVVADFMCGLFDQHGRGRKKGALDDLFGVEHDGAETGDDFFEGGRWVETDQDDAYDYRTYRELLGDEPGFAVAERRLEGPYVRGRAVYLNRSPQRYLRMRAEGKGDGRPLLRHVGVEPWVRATGDVQLEVTAWEREGRTFVFVVRNPAPPDAKTVPVTLLFRDAVKGVVNERTGEELGGGKVFRADLKRTEAILLSLTR